MMRTLVVGAGGFIGRHLMRTLPHAVAYAGDVRNASHLIQAVQEENVQVIVNLSGIFRGTLSEMTDVHVEGARALSSASFTTGCRIISAGSAAEYGMVPPVPVTEDTRCAPVSDYGRTKLQATQQLGEEAVIFRPSNVLGPGMSSSLLLGNVIHQLKSGKTEVRISSLRTIRDYVDVRDVTAAIALLLTAPPGIYNVSSGVGTSTGALLETLRQCSGIKFEVEEDPSLITQDQLDVFIADSSKIKGLSWAPGMDLDRSVRDTWESA